MDGEGLLSGFIGSLVYGVFTDLMAFLTGRWQVKQSVEMQGEWEVERRRTRRLGQENLRAVRLLGEWAEQALSEAARVSGRMTAI